MTEDIYDLKQTNDIPQDMKQVMKIDRHRRGYGEKSKRVIEMFKAADRPLNNKEIRIGYYRKYSQPITCSAVSVLIHYLRAQQVLEKVMYLDKKAYQMKEVNKYKS